MNQQINQQFACYEDIEAVYKNVRFTRGDHHDENMTVELYNTNVVSDKSLAKAELDATGYCYNAIAIWYDVAMHDMEKCVEYLILSKDRNCPMAFFNLALRMSRNKDTDQDEYLELLQRAVEFEDSGDHHWLYFKIAHIYMEKNDIENFDTYFNIALEKESPHAAFSAALTYTRDEIWDVENAMQCIRLGREWAEKSPGFEDMVQHFNALEEKIQKKYAEKNG